MLAGSWNVAKGDRVAIAMRNCPAWIVAYMAVIKAGGIATLINGWWQADEMRHALAPRRARADHRRRAARRAARGGRLHDPDRRAAGRAAARRGAGAVARARRRGGPARDRARGRCHHPVHLGLDRPRQGRGLDPPRGDHRRLCLCDRPRRPARHQGARRASRRRTRPRPWSTCRSSTSPARCRCCSTAS